MNIITFDIPEQHDDQAAWLEGYLTGIQLPELVTELEAVHQPNDHLELHDILGDALNDVLANGLARLSSGQLRRILTNPRTLFELQEHILTGGSQHWINRSAASNEVKTITDRSWQTIRPSLSATTPVSASRPHKRSATWFRQPLFVSLATAAAVLAAVFLPRQFESAPINPVTATGWGWDRDGALDESLPADQYLARLGDSADEWFRKRPESASEVATRIAKFRQGCSTLILASHRPLASEDRRWLVDKCRAWASKLDAHLTAIEAGELPQTVRNAADETVGKLREALQKRSEEISARTA